MFKQLKSILFATTLLPNCKPAFEFAASLAVRYQATLVLLHVIEKSMPDYAENRVKALLGEKWNQIAASQENAARQALIGKQSSSQMIREALNEFCTQVGVIDAGCTYKSKEIVISHGEVVEEILAQAEKYCCDLIVLGAREGFLSSRSIGPIIKSVMRNSRISVLVVPPEKA